ncbi:MAG: TIGR02186 family protein, partial [Desulfobacterales bacterium]
LENAPALYILLLPPGPDWEKKAATLNLGIDNLKQQIGISKSETAPDDIFRMFLKLKRSEKLYSELPGAVSYSAGENGRRRFTAACRLPSSTAVGKYTVKATTIANGDRSAELSRDLTVQEVGFVEMVNRMASKRRLAYGVAAVLIALFSGALMGLLFKSSGRH